MQAGDFVLVDILDIAFSYLFASELPVLFFNLTDCDAMGMSDDSNRATSAMLSQSQKSPRKNGQQQVPCPGCSELEEGSFACRERLP